MLRTEFQDKDNNLTIRIEGRLVGAFAEDLMERVVRRSLPKNLFVNLSELRFIDDLGDELLLWLGRIGAIFVADNVYSAGVCERLNLPLLSQVSEDFPCPN
jgi:hypothetical protein